MQTFSKLLNFSRGSFWIPTTLCYPQNGTVCPLTPFQAFRFWDIFFQEERLCFQTIILSTTNHMLSSKLNVLSCNSHSKWSDFKNSFMTSGCFYEMIILSTNNPMLFSKLNILSGNSIPTGQIWKIPSQTGVVFFFKMIILSTNNLMLTSKLNILSHISVFLNIIWSMFT